MINQNRLSGAGGAVCGAKRWICLHLALSKAMAAAEIFEVTSTVWLWHGGKAAWVFATIDPGTAMAIRAEAFDRIGGWGSIKVEAMIGETRWRTSLFPHKESGGLLLPLKAEVRRREGIDVGDMITVAMSV
jgi:hypothetical protein